MAYIWPRALHAMLGRDRARLLEHDRVTVAAIQLLDHLPRHPVVTVSQATEVLGFTAPTARKAIELLEDLSVLQETTGKQRDRVYVYHEYLQILTADEA